MKEISNPQKEKDFRSKVFLLEKKITEEMPTTTLDVKNYFSHGVYAREIFIPAGAIITGHIHKFENLNIMSKGELSIVTPNGVIRVKAPYTVVSPPGTKRVAFAHKDTIWTTIHGTNEKNVDEIEKIFIAHSEEEFTNFIEKCEDNKCLGEQ